MEAIQTAEPSVRDSIGPDTVWAILKENAVQLEKLRESQKETDRKMKETDRQIKEYNRRFGEFTRRFGEVVEYMIAPNLCEKFREFDLIFPKANSGTRVSDHENNIHFEIDVMLENGDKAMLVEVKTKLATEHINDHIERLEKMRKYADLHGDKRSFLGAVAGVVMTSNVKDYALRQGFFAIEPSGETFSITQPDDKPKEW
ncbi:MAG: hypothetical protein LBH43_15995 [Treponema sp.]|jgi:hypothetical protein|nr:hypothetical protein [Treponema sp.]